MRTGINVVAAYVAWFAVAFLAARGHLAAAVLPSLAAVVLHLGLTPAGEHGQEIRLLFVALLIGIAVETALVALGFVVHAEGLSFGIVPPAFMIGLWLAFATMTNVALRWLRHRPFLTALLAFVAAGPSYYAGAKLGAIALGEPALMSCIGIGLVWMPALPLLMYAARRLDQPRS